MSGGNKKLIFILSAVILALIVLIAVAKKNGWIGKGSAIKVTAEHVKRHTIVETVSASGKIFPETEVKISPDVSGEIIEILFEEGDSVVEGDLIIKIRPDIYISIVERTEAALNQAKANLANANARLAQVNAQFENAGLAYNRNVKLYEQKVISESEYENAVVAFRNAEGEKEAALQNVKAAEYSVKSGDATLKEAKDNLIRTSIYSPMNGIISALHVEKGERVVGTTQMPGTEMLSIANLNNMEVQVDVSENDIIRVSVGDTADTEVDAYLDRKFLGVVKHIANSANVASQLTSEQVTNFKVKISLLKSSYQDLIRENNLFPFKPGMSASVEIQTDKKQDVLSVPIQSVTVREKEDKAGKSEVVFLLKEDRVVESEVKTGIQDDRYIEIKEGLSENQQIVTGPYRAISTLLKDGDYVKVVSEKDLSD